MAEPAITPQEIVRSGLCIGCGACGPVTWDWQGLRKAEFRDPPPAFDRTCPFSPRADDEDVIAAARFPAARHRDARIGRFEAAYVGHVDEGEYRAGGSSGGLVTWVAAELLRTGAVDGVAHVSPTGGEDGVFFSYGISRSIEAVRRGARSRYFPVDLAEAIAEIRRTPGRYAIVGVPCFIKAVNLLRASDPVIAERVTHLLGLFCGHMKSARFVDSFAWQLGVERRNVRAVEYRRKDPGRPANWYTAQLTLAEGSVQARDWWHLADGDWGAGFFMAEACNWCDDVVAETADISFGDAWVEPYSSDGRGTNVVVARSSAMQELVARGIAEGRLALTPVDADFVAETQAAGLRQRREGLAYRLARRTSGLMPVKRVAPSRGDLALRRRAIYRVREAISRWSHRMAWLALTTRTPSLYVRWARATLGIYQALAYGRGKLGKTIDSVSAAVRRATGA